MPRLTSSAQASGLLCNRCRKGFFYAIVDDDAAKGFKFRSDSTKKTVTLAENLPNGKHSLQLYKLSNNTSANMLYGFEIGGKAELLKPAKLPKRKIEFYGNSITAAHGVDVPTGMRESGIPEEFNNYYTYAALTAPTFQRTILHRGQDRHRHDGQLVSGNYAGSL